MDNVLHLLDLPGALWSWALSVALQVLEILRPSFDALVLGVAAIYVHRWMGNKTAADLVLTGAGVAYNKLGAQLAANGTIDFETAKKLAVEAGVAAATGFGNRKLGKLTPEQITDAIDGAFGKLLAADPSFKVVEPALTPLDGVAVLAPSEIVRGAPAPLVP